MYSRQNDLTILSLKVAKYFRSLNYNQNEAHINIYTTVNIRINCFLLHNSKYSYKLFSVNSSEFLGISRRGGEDAPDRDGHDQVT